MSVLRGGLRLVCVSPHPYLRKLMISFLYLASKSYKFATMDVSGNSGMSCIRTRAVNGRNLSPIDSMIRWAFGAFGKHDSVIGVGCSKASVC